MGESKNEWIIDNYLQSDGDIAPRTSEAGCYRMEKCGDLPWNGCQLNVTRDDNVIKYNCFSANCPCGGGVIPITRRGVPANVQRPIHSVQERGKGNRGDKERPLPYSFVRAIPRQAMGWLRKYGIGKEEIVKRDIGWDKSSERLIFPVHINGTYRGYLSRDVRAGMQGQRGSKWLNLVEEGTIYEANIQGERVNGGCGGIGRGYVVENPASACKVAKLRGADTIATLGTAIPDGKLQSIADWGARRNITHLTLMYDPDVPKWKVRKIQRLLRGKFLTVKVEWLNVKPVDLEE